MLTDTIITAAPPQIPCTAIDTANRERENSACLPVCINASLVATPLSLSFINW